MAIRFKEVQVQEHAHQHVHGHECNHDHEHDHGFERRGSTSANGTTMSDAALRNLTHVCSGGCCGGGGRGGDLSSNSSSNSSHSGNAAMGEAATEGGAATTPQNTATAAAHDAEHSDGNGNTEIHENFESQVKMVPEGTIIEIFRTVTTKLPTGEIRKEKALSDRIAQMQAIRQR